MEITVTALSAFLRKTPGEALREYFDRPEIGLPPEFDWSVPEAELSRPLLGAIEKMSRVQRDRISNDAERVHGLSDEPGQHAQPEAGDVAVPDKVFGGAGFCGVDEAFGDLGHGTLRWLSRSSTVLKCERQSTNTLKSRRKRKWRVVPRKAFRRADAGNRRAVRIRTQVPVPAGCC